MLSASIRRLVFGLGTVALLAGPSHAEVTFTGTVTPGTPAEVGPEDVVTVGPLQDSQGTGDPRGTIVVDGGSLFEAGQLLVGDDFSALARVEVTGAGTKLQVTDAGNPQLNVGIVGSGYLKIDDGAWVNVGSVQDRSGGMRIGRIIQRFGNPFPALSEGSVDVEGESTLLTVGGSLYLGDRGSAQLMISDGAVVRVGSADGENGVYNYGKIVVSGPRSELQTTGIFLGDPEPRSNSNYSPELLIQEGATVRSSEPWQFNDAEVGYGGRVFLDGGTLALPLKMDGDLSGGGTVTQDVNVGLTGRIMVRTGQKMEVLGSLSSLGRVLATDGELNVFGVFRNERYKDDEVPSATSDFLRSEVYFAGGMVNKSTLSLVDSLLRLGPPGAASASSGISLAAAGAGLTARRSRIELLGSSTVLGTLELIDSELALDLPRSGILVGEFGREWSSRLVLEGGVISGVCCENIVSNTGVIEARGQGNRISARVLEYGGNGVLEMGPDSSITLNYAEFFGGVTMAAGSEVLLVERGDLRGLSLALSDSNLAHASVTGASEFPELYEVNLAVSGELLIEADGLMNLAPNQVFKLIEAERLEVNFSEYDLPDLPGTLEFLPQLSDTELSLLVIDTTEVLPGDFSGDGVVDAADYTLWRDGLSGGSPGLDLAMWRANFGRTLSSPVAGGVPEPPALVAALSGLLAVGRRRG